MESAHYEESNGESRAVAKWPCRYLLMLYRKCTRYPQWHVMGHAYTMDSFVSRRNCTLCVHMCRIQAIRQLKCECRKAIERYV